MAELSDISWNNNTNTPPSILPFSPFYHGFTTFQKSKRPSWNLTLYLWVIMDGVNTIMTSATSEPVGWRRGQGVKRLPVTHFLSARLKTKQLLIRAKTQREVLWDRGEHTQGDTTGFRFETRCCGDGAAASLCGCKWKCPPLTPVHDFFFFFI